MSTDWIKKRLKMSSTLPLGAAGGQNQPLMGSLHSPGHPHHHHDHAADGSCCGHDHHHDHHHHHDHDEDEDCTNPKGCC